jgi:catechol 2,3-dioxygenase-like lactoylglutathione lyase family enzyme
MEAQMRIGLSSVLVDDQEKALVFYTEKLGFLKKTDIPAGEFRWLTVVAPDGDDNVELVLEPVAFPPAKVYQEALFKAGIPATAFISVDVRQSSAGGEAGRLQRPVGQRWQKKHSGYFSAGQEESGHPPVFLGPVGVLFREKVGSILCPNCDHENSSSFTVLHNQSKSLRNILGPIPRCDSIPFL